MRKLATLLLLSCSIMARSQTFPVVGLKVSGPDSNRINMVMLSDGFQAAELPTFQTNADSIRVHFFDESPLKEYVNFFNVYCINVPSVESGTDHPATATDVVEPVIPVADVNTYFNASFDGGNTHRALVCNNEPAVYTVLANNFPAADIIMLIANSLEYGGTGGNVATSSLNASSYEIVRHEFGHTFAGLADEYWAGPQFANEKANMTQENDPALVKWKNWLNVGGVGIVAYGATAPSSSWYRPHHTCKMCALYNPFCHVCQEAIITRIYQVMRPIDWVTPDTATAQVYAANPITFTMKLIKPVPNTLVVKWKLNTTILASTDTSVQITGAQLIPGANTLTAYITDTTGLSRSYWPGTGYQFAVTWDISNGPTGINVTKQHNNDKFFYKLYPIPAKDNVTLEYDNSTRDENLQLSITDISGRVVKSETLKLQAGKQVANINTSSLATGTYIFSLVSKSVNVAQQVTIE